MSDRSGLVAVIGAGYFGCNVALSLAEAGYKVVVLERLPEIIHATSRHNTNRVHQGFHYPRDLRTAIECRERYGRFETVFAPAIRSDIPNFYFIANDGSRTAPDAFLNFCEQAGLSYSRIQAGSRAPVVDGCSLGIVTSETICDPDIVRRIVLERMAQCPQLKVARETTATTIVKRASGFQLTTEGAFPSLACDVVVNCSYADINRLTVQLGHDVAQHQFEYTVVPIIEADLPTAAVTVMDGPFVTLFPYDRPRRFLLYHVRHSVIASEVARTVKHEWLDRATSPFAALDPAAFFDTLRSNAAQFVPGLAAATCQGFLAAPRMVLANHEADDSRPSMVQDYGDGYLTVFSGKIDRSLDIADSVRDRVAKYFDDPVAAAPA